MKKLLILLLIFMQVSLCYAIDPPIGYWTLTEDNYSEGVFQDLTANDNDGTPANVPSFTTNQKGIADSATVLNGSTDLINCTDSADLNPAATLSISCWVNLNSLWSSAGIVVGRDDTGGIPARNYNLDIETNRSIQFRIWQSDDVPKSVYYGTPIDVSTWYHIVVVADGSYVRLYLNSVEVATPVAYDGTLKQDVRDTFIGDIDAGHYYPFYGNICYVRIYDSAPTPAEVRELYNTDKSMMLGILTLDSDYNIKTIDGNISYTLDTWDGN